MSDIVRATRRLSERSHPRRFQENLYVYPVLSRRAGGVSIGINLNLNRACTFNCLYCQVDRSHPGPAGPVRMPRLAEELRTVLAGLAPGGPLWSLPEFAALPVGKKRVADIAFSGDGEPTACTGFARAVERAAEAKHAFTHTRDAAKLVVITNATRLDKPDVRDALRLMDGHGGEVWAKLDAGTPEHFARINGTAFPFAKVLGHILDCARERPIVIQSCFARIENAPPPAAEVAAYLERLKEFVTGGAQIKLVQVYTVARPPARGGVSSLSAAEMDALAARVQSETGLAAAAYYGDVAEISDRTA